MFWKIIFLGFFLYVLYRFIFGLALPVYKATQNIRKGFRDVQEKANEQMRNQQAKEGPAGNTTTANSGKKQTLGEYIEFEEVK